jgi:hypothetical protein
VIGTARKPRFKNKMTELGNARLHVGLQLFLSSVPTEENFFTSTIARLPGATLMHEKATP